MRTLNFLTVCLGALALSAGCVDVRGRTCGEENCDRFPRTGVALIDDMEDGNSQSLPHTAEFLGFWYTYDHRKQCRIEFCCAENPTAGLDDSCADDMEAGCTGVMSPVPERDQELIMTGTSAVAQAAEGVAPNLVDEVAQSVMAAHISGGGYPIWGAGMGITFKDAAKHDASVHGFTGLRFIATSPLATQSKSVPVHVKVQDTSSNPSDGVCQPKLACDETEGCYANFEVEIQLSNTWTEYRLTWDDFVLPKTGQYKAGRVPKALDPSGIYQVQFEAEAGADFDIWIDNLGFIAAD